MLGMPRSISVVVVSAFDLGRIVVHIIQPFAPCAVGFDRLRFGRRVVDSLAQSAAVGIVVVVGRGNERPRKLRISFERSTLGLILTLLLGSHFHGVLSGRSD